MSTQRLKASPLFHTDFNGPKLDLPKHLIKRSSGALELRGGAGVKQGGMWLVGWPETTFAPQCRIRVRLDYSNMRPNGQSALIWTMPAPLGKALNYSDQQSIDVEVNMGFNPARPELLSCYLVAGSAVRFGEVINVTHKHGIDIQQGEHDLWIDWGLDHVAWGIDAVELQRSTELVPTMPAKLVLSREMNGNSTTASPDDVAKFLSVTVQEYDDGISLAERRAQLRTRSAAMQAHIRQLTTRKAELAERARKFERYT